MEGPRYQGYLSLMRKPGTPSPSSIFISSPNCALQYRGSTFGIAPRYRQSNANCTLGCSVLMSCEMTCCREAMLGAPARPVPFRLISRNWFICSRSRSLLPPVLCEPVSQYLADWLLRRVLCEYSQRSLVIVRANVPVHFACLPCTI